MNTPPSRAALPVLILALVIRLTQAAPPPGTTVLPPIDLSPGDDVPSPASFALNRSNHKLYVGARRDITGLKVIDTTNNKVTGGFTFASYPGADPLRGLAMAVDESAAPDGNKLYVVGKPSNPYVLRIIDSATDTELTGRGTDIVLPIGPLRDESGPFRIVVNPTNHKVYISTYEGQIVVVDGVSRQVLKSFNPDAGWFLALDPVAQKVFVLGANGGAIIDSATDTVTAPPKPLLFEPTSAVFNEADERIYFGAYKPDSFDHYGIFVLNGRTGRLTASKTYPGVQRSLASIAVVPKGNRIYAGTDFQTFSCDATDLSLVEEFTQPAPALTFDPAGPGLLLAGESVYQAAANAVHLINPTTGKITHRTTAYRPAKVVVNRSTNRFYVLDSMARDFVVIDGQDRSILARVSLPPAQSQAPRDIAVSERLNRIYVTRLAPTESTEPQLRLVDVYNGATNRFLRSFKLHPNSTGIVAVDDTRGHIYFAGSRPSGSFDGAAIPFLEVYDEDSETFLTSIKAKPAEALARPALAVNPVSGRIYMSTSYRGVAIFDGTTLTLVKDPVDTGSTYPFFLGINSTTNKIYVVGPDRISVIDGVTDVVTASFTAGGTHDFGAAGFSGIAVDEEADTINITDQSWNGHDFVTRLLTLRGQGNHSFVGAVPVGDPEAGPTFNPVTRQFLVPNVFRGLIKVIQAGDTGP